MESWVDKKRSFGVMIVISYEPSLQNDSVPVSLISSQCIIIKNEEEKETIKFVTTQTGYKTKTD